MPKEHVPVSKGLVLVNSGCQVLTHVLNIGVLFWLNQFLIRRLSTEEYALYPLVIVPLQLVPILTNVLTGGLARFTVEAYAKGDDRRIEQIVSTMMPLMSLGALMTLGLGWGFAEKAGLILDLDPEQEPAARIMLLLLFVGAALKLQLAPLCVGPVVRQKFYVQSVVTFATLLVRVTILVALLYGHSTRVTWVVVSTVIAEAFGQLATVLVSRRLVPALRFRTSAIDWPSARRLTSFGVWNSVQQVSALIRRQADVLLLTHFATKTDVANFFLGGLVFTQIQRMTLLALGPLAPPLVALHARGDRSGIAGIYLRGARLGLWAIGTVAPALIIFREAAVRLYVGEERFADFADTPTVMGILGFVAMTRFGNVMLGQIASATERVKYIALQGLLVQATNLVITFYLVGQLRLGAVGSAMATLIAIATIQPILNWRLGRAIAGVTFGQWLRKSIFPGLLPTLCGGLVWITAREVLQPDSWLMLGAAFAAGLCVYGLVLVIFAFDDADRADLRRVGTRIVGLLGISGR